MPARPRTMPTTEEPELPTEERDPEGRPVLLTAFPTQVAIPLPPMGDVVGRAWLLAAGIVDNKVSREHLRFSRRGSRIEVEDIGSRGGTYLGSVELPRHERAPIVDGTILRIGNTILVYRESFTESLTRAEPLGDLEGPWGLSDVRRALERLPTLPAHMLNVLVEGETGTGKELLAREIARKLGRDARYSPINVAAIPRDRFEADLFGWERGSFSGSTGANQGWLRASDGGVIFFDELEALPLEIQPKLLRFLQLREVAPLGATRGARADVAVIAATNQPVAEMVDQNAFRRDLAARFNVMLHLPPLAERPEDVFAIFAARWRALRGGSVDIERVDPHAVTLMMLHHWPENVREIERLVLSVSPDVGLKQAVVRQVLGVEASVAARTLTRESLVNALAACNGIQSEAARRLKIDRTKLRRLMKEYGIS